MFGLYRVEGALDVFVCDLDEDGELVAEARLARPQSVEVEDDALDVKVVQSPGPASDCQPDETSRGSTDP